MQETIIPFLNRNILHLRWSQLQLKKRIEIPKNYKLLQNYPNPFNQMTKINFYLLQSAPLRITIYNVFGETVRILTVRKYFVGDYFVNWDKNINGFSITSGVYFYLIQVG